MREDGGEREAKLSIAPLKWLLTWNLKKWGLFQMTGQVAWMKRLTVPPTSGQACSSHRSPNTVFGAGTVIPLAKGVRRDDEFHLVPACDAESNAGELP